MALDRWSVWSASQDSPATPALLTKIQRRLINYPTDLFSLQGCAVVEGNISAGTRGWREEDDEEEEEEEEEEEDAVAAEEQMGEALGDEVDEDEEELERILEEDGEEEELNGVG